MSNKKWWLIGGAVALVGGLTTFFIIRSRRKSGGKFMQKSSSKLPVASKYSKFGNDTLKVVENLTPLAFGTYNWAGTSGMPIDIEFKDGEIIFQKTSDGSTYCTGFTFSVFFVTALNRGLLDDWTNDDIEKLHKVWNQGEPTAKPKLCVDAISKPINNHKPLGKEISLNNALEGDYCQIWRTTGTGHSVIFLERVMKNNKVVGIKYISSNASVNPKTGRTGVGEKIEYFSDSGGKVIRENTYYARMNK